MDILLKLENASVTYGGVHALQNATVDIDEGEIVALMGPNGAGKSTALKAIFGLAPMSHGKVLWHGSSIDPIPHEVVRRGISFVPQGRRVFPHLTILENLELGGVIQKEKSELLRRMNEVMEIFPVLKHKENHKAGALSGGEQQMLALARGLVSDPKVLLLDEPSLGLSPKFVKEVFLKIKEINERHKTAILVVEHNLKSLFEIVDRAYVLDKGSVVAEGDAKSLLESDILKKVFVGALE